MPAYEFKCLACDKIFTLILKIAELEEGKAACPHCQTGKVTQVLSSFFAKTSRKS
jgi:putative FmdB family regulatory protein